MVGAVIRGGDAVVLVRRTGGPSAGRWDLPGGAVLAGETAAEAVARAASSDTGTEVVCGPFLGWTESPDRDDHRVRLMFEGVELAPRDATSSDRGLPDGIAAVEWMAVWDVNEARLADGVAEFLSEIGVIDLVV